ncbi:hypothetical protein [Bradyrhizobium prioriisuperbiae]|uniref:hypothetical protein n=1 Tax=Bradyrhizobium prioriisuperbiae TaxID=2854389 RepID=UPI0028E3DE55|nr:hypothetical protein [Bradyrhizobium prioritasuperba]
MTKERHQLADMTADDSDGLLSNLLAEERDWSWHSLWQLGSWAVGAIGAIVIAFFAVHTSNGLRRDQIASADLTRQSQQIQWVAKESQTETRRLSSAIDTLNGDRDRLFTRVTVLEQGLDSVTGSVTRQTTPASLVMSSVAQPIRGVPPPMIAGATATLPLPSEAAHAAPSAPSAAQATAAPDLRESDREAVKDSAKDSLPASTVYAPPDPAAPKLIEAHPITLVQPEKAAGPPLVIAALPDSRDTDTAGGAAEIAVQRTEFGIDLGGANSIDGLRALWQGIVKSKGEQVASLRPIIVVKERRNGLGLQLRLVAGPLNNAAAAARICAAMAEGNRACEATVFDGQRLAIRAADETPVPTPRPVRKRKVQHLPREEATVAAQPATPAADPPTSTTVSGLFRNR